MEENVRTSSPEQSKKAYNYGIASFITSWFFGLVGIILGLISLSTAKKTGETEHKPWAIGGLVVGGFQIVMSSLLLIGLLIPTLNGIQAAVDANASDKAKQACVMENELDRVVAENDSSFEYTPRDCEETK